MTTEIILAIATLCQLPGVTTAISEYRGNGSTYTLEQLQHAQRTCQREYLKCIPTKGNKSPAGALTECIKDK